jgi:hypothetical protein
MIISAGDTFKAKLLVKEGSGKRPLEAGLAAYSGIGFVSRLRSA